MYVKHFLLNFYACINQKGALLCGYKRIKHTRTRTRTHSNFSFPYNLIYELFISDVNSFCFSTSLFLHFEIINYVGVVYIMSMIAPLCASTFNPFGFRFLFWQTATLIHSFIHSLIDAIRNLHTSAYLLPVNVNLHGCMYVCSRTNE